MPKSRQTILNAAKTCFLQHGYQATNVSMISRYADISRVTIHKQFGSKEDLFRAVIEEHCHMENMLSDELLAQDSSCWQKLAQLLKAWANPLFNDIEQELIRNELLFAGRKYCEDLIIKHRNDNIAQISALLNDAVQGDEIQLQSLQMTITEFAELIEINFKGLFMAHNQAPIDLLIDNNIRLYARATKIN
ncbi:TetR/AcrR family transcriptional regulator [Thalassotalea sp. Y01]|uniref:TetR/AcrR family transcriptional regulator n=1 Tax=Thalassotalea sp. Y01 TaxID=2729613 RepID=UPI00145DC6A8|nr:TetR/AcrR family transcriptional regulator [Thalassotalea sp. Y01]NMP17761.1 TetR/AcrR family transcriptional regulator [Thalassotalea sp. Y01]